MLLRIECSFFFFSPLTTSYYEKLVFKNEIPQESILNGLRLHKIRNSTMVLLHCIIEMFGKVFFLFYVFLFYNFSKNATYHILFQHAILYILWYFLL